MINAGDLLGQTNQPGRYADLIAVSSDPLKNVTVLERVDFVMKAGVVYKK
ncbi:MAG: hypothetical protein H7X97_02520 [Opitutaceae bacterium]|nr:hypothetical protein [Verrucomicrobiales bacterium]